MFRFLKRKRCESLLVAIESGEEPGVRRALSAGADPNCVDHHSWPCLVKAASIRRIDIATALLDAGALPDARCPARLDERESEVYEELRRRGLTATMPNDSWSALAEAVSQHDLPMVRLLMERGANPNLEYGAKLQPDTYVWDSFLRDMGSQAGLDLRDKDGWTPLMEAAERGDPEITKTLLAGNADVRATTKNGVTSLMRAAMAGHTLCVEVLVDNGAPIDETNPDGWTALFCASARGRLSAMKFLLARGADVNKKNRSNATALMWAVQGSAEAVKLLLSAGAQVNEVSNKGGSALMAAVMSQRTEVVKILLDAGADPTICDKYGTPLVELAHSTYNTEIIEMVSTALL